MSDFRVLAVAAWLALGCGSSQQSADTKAVGDPDWSKESTHEPTPAPEIEEAPRNPRCSGSELDASLLAGSGVCDIEGHAQDLPADVVASLASQSTEVVSGQDVGVQLLLTNTGNGTAELFLDHSCGFENLTTNKVLRDSHDKRLDRVGRTDCPLDAACAGQVAHFSLAAKGIATITLPLNASVSVIGEGCEELPGRALSPGNYSVAWKTPYAADPFTTQLKVQALLRLPKSKCKSYAQEVAKKAEPDAKLRAGVEKELLAACKKEQPSQAFAQCRMSATNESELEACQEVKLPR